MMWSRYRGKAIENIEGVCKRGDWVYGSLVPDQCHEAHPWILGDICEGEEVCIEPEFWAPVDKETIGQGIKREDKKGNEIYEGDIVRCFSLGEGKEIIGVVQYSVASSCFVVSGRKVNGDINRIVLTMRQCWNIRRVGNIHDNPELMEVN